jgi:hypothetical protein
LTEIYLCHACSCQEILRTETAGQVIIMGVGALLGAAPQLQPADVTGPWLQPVLGMALRLLERCHTQKEAEAAEAAAEEEEEEEESSDDEEGEEDLDESDEDEDDEEPDDAEDAENDEDARYLAFLTQQAKEMADHENWEEEAELDYEEMSLLEDVDEKAYFMAKMDAMRSANPAAADGMIQALDSECAALFQSLCSASATS